MSDSVGKISLDLEVKSDIEKQINSISNMIGKNMKAAIEGSTGNMFSGMKKQMNNTLGSMGSALKKSLDGMKNTAKNTLSGVFATAKDIKLPRFQFPKPNGVIPDQGETSSPIRPRAPPISKVNTGANFEAVKAQIDNLTQSLDITNAKIEQQREKLAGLKESYANAFNQGRKNKLQEDILKTESAINSLTAKSDKTGFKLADLDKQFQGMGNSAREASIGINEANTKMKDTIRSSTKASIGLKGFNRHTNNTQTFGNALGGLGGKAHSTGNKFGHMGSTIASSFRRVLKQVLIVRIMYKALRGLIDYTSSALMTNAQFVQSLSIVKTNLQVAFMPIYTAILPALNALMQGIATVTTYIASAISALFGKTYNQSFKAAKGLNATKAAMGGVGKATAGAGKAAKKAGEEIKGALAGFDEINQLNLDKGNDSDVPDVGAGGGGIDVPPMVMPPLVDMSGIDKFKDAMATIFQPFKRAWENEGQNTINAVKYALEEMKELMKVIGMSWLEVWTNGTGQLIVEALLRILQLIFNVIGDIAKATRLAWEENNLGTLLIQTIANSILYILNLIEQIGISWRDVWNNGSGQQMMSTILMILQNIFQLIGGIASAFTNAWVNAGTGTAIIQAIHNVLQAVLDIIKRVGESLNNVWGEVGNVVAQTFLDILKSTLEVLANLGEKLVWVWDNGGQHLFEGFLRLGAKIFELAGYIYTEFVTPFIDWFVNLIVPAVAKVMDAIGDLLDVFSGLISWLVGDGKPVLDTIIIVLTSMAVSFGLVTVATNITAIATKAWTVVSGVATGVTTAFGLAVAFLTSPFGIAVIAIGAAIAIGVLLYKNWDKIKEKAHEMGEKVKEKWEGLKTATHEKFTAMGESIKNKFEEMKTNAGDKSSAIKEKIASNWDHMKSKTSDTFGNMLTTVGSKMSAMKDKIANSGIGRAWDSIWNFSLPHIKMPHFDVRGSFGINPPSAPKFGVNWYAKGGVFDGPQVVGVGEQGKEAVMPLENNTGWIDNLAGQIAGKIGKNNDNETLGILKQILKALTERDGDIILKVGESEFARVAIDSINKAQRQAGHTLLQI
ncbi:hypothetical protein [Clostridium algidicarnis]|uniref:hypothetical protein n=1 Tax=Clostridium algidicarnis TaxID=37659 RepID=UPI00162A5FEA|nr:hypothetical protein [Clostridium algidicarnis]MBB6696243.1 hypothetical protein [Clostridium algidicarnis]